MAKKNIEIKNKKASFEFELNERYMAGIQLQGTEIKSIRQAKASLNEAYCFFKGSELFVLMHISEYDYGSYNNHDPRRERKLLLTKQELRKLQKKSTNTGFTIVPIRLFINEKGYAKLEIALGRGKKRYDKRESIKNKDIKRDLDRNIKF